MQKTHHSESDNQKEILGERAQLHPQTSAPHPQCGRGHPLPTPDPLRRLNTRAYGARPRHLPHPHGLQSIPTFICSTTSLPTGQVAVSQVKSPTTVSNRRILNCGSPRHSLGELIIVVGERISLSATWPVGELNF